jgi:hypothetical protein
MGREYQWELPLSRTHPAPLETIFILHTYHIKYTITVKLDFISKSSVFARYESTVIINITII